MTLLKINLYKYIDNLRKIVSVDQNDGSQNGTSKDITCKYLKTFVALHLNYCTSLSLQIYIKI